MWVIRRLFHRHTWKMLKVLYRYWDYRTGKRITVRRCQCYGCGRIRTIHFDGKDILYM